MATVSLADIYGPQVRAASTQEMANPRPGSMGAGGTSAFGSYVDRYTGMSIPMFFGLCVVAWLAFHYYD